MSRTHIERGQNSRFVPLLTFLVHNLPGSLLRSTRASAAQGPYALLEHLRDELHAEHGILKDNEKYRVPDQEYSESSANTDDACGRNQTREDRLVGPAFRLFGPKRSAVRRLACRARPLRTARPWSPSE